MKKIILTVLLVTTLRGFAQETQEDSAEKILQKMTVELRLTDAQHGALKPLIQEQMETRNDTKVHPENEEGNKAKFKELAKKINGVLTLEQKELRRELR